MHFWTTKSAKATLALALTLNLISAELSAESTGAKEKTKTMPTHQLFYRGDMDDQVITAPNGARVNNTYASFVAEGPWAEAKTWEVTLRIHTITGYGIANHTFIEGETGLIMIDTGQNVGAGLEVLKMKQAFSDKPVVAIIYTHHHYTRGTKAIVETYPEIDIPIFGHPKVDENMQALFSYLAPGRFQRGFIQFGHDLPSEGPDAEYSISEPEFEDPALNAGGHLPVTHPVEDGEQVNIDGLNIIFHHAVADTEDSLIVHIPELDLVVHNTAVMGFMFPMYTLRGEFYRSSPEVIASIDKLRELKPEHLVGCHGSPVTGREQVYEFATAHRDALAYVYQQTVRGINRGMGPDELAREIRLPKQLAEIPELYPAYVDVEHMVRGVYGGLVGWFANDTAELHPPAAEELGAEIVSGFGGADRLLARAEKVLQERHYNLAATLVGYVLAEDPDHESAKLLRAAALRKMAQATPTGIQTRNFLLHEALQLEGEIPSAEASGRLPLPLEAIAAMSPGSTLEVLAYSIDGSQAVDLVATVRIDITDTDQTFTLSIRHGATELTESTAQEHDIRLALDRFALAELLLGHKPLQALIAEERALFSGMDDKKGSFLKAYEKVM